MSSRFSYIRVRTLSLVAATLATALLSLMPAQAQLSVLYNFGTTSNSGANPSNPGILAQGRDGNIYGTTVNGGTNGLGTVFQVTPSGTLNVIYNFNEAQGYAPYGGLTLGTDGNLYGATLYGGTSGFGTLFQITPSGNLNVLYDFTGGSDGFYPSAPPVLGADGNWYGTSQGSFSGNGTLYRLTPTGKFTVLYTFKGPQGSDQPKGPLFYATDGNFYGTTAIGGADNQGMLFQVSLAGKLKVIFSFDSTHGSVPLAGVTEGADGNLYGTTSAGGSNGAGVVYKASLGGKPSVLYNVAGGTGPNVPYGGLVQGNDGNFYGTTYQGGATNDGDIFSITSKGKVTPLFDFDFTNGYRPETTLIQHTNGLFYGDTAEGGTGVPCENVGCGVFFSWNQGLKPFVSFVSPTGSGKIGDTVQILGQGFTGATSITFDGVSGSFNVVSDTYLTATVPTGAKSGAVAVKTPSGTLTSNQSFRVTPLILSFSPTSGPVGTSVTINGQSLTQASKVLFNKTKATFTVNSDTQVTAIVPTGAKTGKISIVTPGGTAVSSQTFTVTP